MHCYLSWGRCFLRNPDGREENGPMSKLWNGKPHRRTILRGLWGESTNGRQSCPITGTRSGYSWSIHPDARGTRHAQATGDAPGARYKDSRSANTAPPYRRRGRSRTADATQPRGTDTHHQSLKTTALDSTRFRLGEDVAPENIASSLQLPFRPLEALTFSQLPI